MGTRYYANAPATTLASSAAAADTSLSVSSVTGLPIQYPYTLIIDRGQATEEVVEVTAASGTTLTVTRGVDSTLASTHSVGATVEHGISARDVRESNEHINDSTGVHGLGASDSVVGTDTTQTLTNKDLSSATNTFPATLATSADLTTHEADTSTHGVTGAVVGTTDTQTLTNKDLSAATNTFPSELVESVTTGLTIQTGSTTITLTSQDTNTQAVTFPTAFSGAAVKVFPSWNQRDIAVNISTAANATGVTFRAFTTDGTSKSVTVTVDWFAIGPK